MQSHQPARTMQQQQRDESSSASQTKPRKYHLFRFSFCFPPYSVPAFSRELSRYIPWICGVIVLLKGFGSDVLVGSPISRLIELTICRQYYFVHDPALIDGNGYVDEKYCKVDQIQTELALIMGSAGFLSSLTELLMSIPLAIIADRKGRKLVMFLNVTGGVLYYLWVAVVCNFYNIFPPISIIAVAAFYLIGGGPSVFTALVFAMIADVSTEKSRITAFYYIQSIVQVVQLLSPTIGSILLSTGIWTPFYIGLPILTLLPIVVLILPETSTRPPAKITTVTESDPLCPIPEPAYRKSPDNVETSKSNFLLSLLGLCLSEIYNFFKVFSYDTRISLCLLSFFVTNFGRAFLSILIQYVSKRYGWELAQAGFLMSFKSLISMFLFLSFLPSLTRYLSEKRGLEPNEINLLVAKGSVVLLTAGCALVGAATTIHILIPALIIVSFGFGYGVAMQSLITSLVPKNHVARLYSAISVVETVGSLFGHPLLAAMFAAGINVGGMALGLPFFTCAGLYSVAGLMVWNIQFELHCAAETDVENLLDGPNAC